MGTKTQMRPSPDIRFDVACVLNRGRRDYQEDALAVDFTVGEDLAYAVLSDGMGGHAAGDVASKIVVTEVFSELKFQSADVDGLDEELPIVLTKAAHAANACMAAHAAENPETKGMGATLVATVVLHGKLFWISIGDSPLFLWRDGRLRQLNEDHSLAPQIDFMVSTGLMAAEVGANHPDRNALTSVLAGEDIIKIDCPRIPFDLRDGDVLICSSDGLQFLENDAIAAILADCDGLASEAMADALIDGLAELDDPDQDNIAMTVIRVRLDGRAARSDADDLDDDADAEAAADAPVEAKARRPGADRPEPALADTAWTAARARLEEHEHVFIRRAPNLAGGGL